MSVHHHPSELARWLRLLALAAAAMLLLLGIAFVSGRADEWQGRVAERDGVALVANPAAPLEPPRSLRLRELWRLGGDSEDEHQLFGVISEVLVDEADRVYLLDQALCTIKIFSPAGEFLREIGREGEGPGEFRYPQGMAFLPEGLIAVFERVPGRIVLLTREGQPAGTHPMPAVEGAAFVGIAGGASDGRSLHLALGYDDYEQSRFNHVRRVAKLGRDGAIAATFAENRRGFDFQRPVIKERIWDDFDSRWDLDAQGRVFMATSWDEYALTCFDADGGKARVVTRPAELRKRSGEERARYAAIFEPFIRQVPGASPEIEPCDHPIVQVHARGEGRFVVLSSQGAFDRPAGSLGVFDAFDAQGRWQRQITLLGEGDPLADGYRFRGDRLFVMKGLLDATLVAAGGADSAAGTGGGETPMAVICYALDAAL